MPESERNSAGSRRKGEITTFYAPPPLPADGRVTLSGDQAHHAHTVCRFHKGDPITIVDGEGLAHFCEVIAITSERCVCRIFKTVKNWGEPPVSVDLASGLSKSTKFDWTCEKATELGASGVIPFLSEKSAIKLDDPAGAGRKVARYQRLVVAAMKQSLRSRLPRIADITTLPQVIAAFSSYHRVLLADATKGSAPFDRAAELAFSARKILLIVGPESGFSPAELEQMCASGAVPISLGPRRLRTETAAVAFLSRIMGLFEA
jgi:16S rRNA (uracil1498-N3)-methyltransferase